MKKMLSIAVFLSMALCLCFITACTTEEEKPASMVFVDDLANPTKQYTFNDKFEFTIKYLVINPGTFEAEIAKFKVGDTISGKILNTDPPKTKWNNDFVGVAGKMTSSNSGINGALMGLTVKMTQTYEKTGGTISEVTLLLEGEGVAEAAQELMGGTYQRPK